jgi:MarR-like DNA-binding transcriptional regulator SgrR of sgrS sRNA
MSDKDFMYEECYQCDEVMTKLKFQLSECQRERDIITETFQILQKHHFKVEAERDRLHKLCTERGIELTNLEQERDELKEKQIVHGKKIDTWMRRAIGHRANCATLEQTISSQKEEIETLTHNNMVLMQSASNDIYHMNELLDKLHSCEADCKVMAEQIIREHNSGEVEEIDGFAIVTRNVDCKDVCCTTARKYVA